ncbi:hypothetical protein [Pseudomonas atagonensis]|uniref:hypothetical protein n=1 Tax=Pseudomonas atagonensis TaxID=2609964 RepID=UPI001407C856|nr:hypothetical protein [Pseudomonas atagonensis]
MATEMLWWEKTVEYFFVRKILPLDALAAPLAGDAEKFFGDLMNESKDGRARLIEFKREKANIKDEVLKYYAKGAVPAGQTFHKAWLAAISNNICPGSLGHWFVYGHVEKDTSDLVLEGRQYGPEKTKPILIQNDDQLGYVQPKALFDYMKRLMVMRSRGGGWEGAMVVATLDGQSVAMDAREFVEKTMSLKPEPKLEIGPTFKPPRMR